MTILELDFGNTSLKWRKITANKKSVVSRLAYADMQLALHDFGAFDRVRCASVLTHLVTQQYLQLLGIGSVEMARSDKLVPGFINAYTKPEKLGVDRWLAALAAKLEAGVLGCLVIDCGTAITVDYINDMGVFEGGYILAGKQLLQSALLKDTASVRFDRKSNTQNWPAWPKDTAQAVQWGADFIVMAVIERAIKQVQAMQGNSEFAIYLTGGDAADVARQLGNTVQYRPDLVLDGLAIALP